MTLYLLQFMLYGFIEIFIGCNFLFCSYWT